MRFLAPATSVSSRIRPAPASSRDSGTNPGRVRGLHAPGDHPGHRRAGADEGPARPHPRRPRRRAETGTVGGNRRPGSQCDRFSLAPGGRRRAHPRQPGWLRSSVPGSIAPMWTGRCPRSSWPVRSLTGDDLGGSRSCWPRSPAPAGPRCSGSPGRTSTSRSARSPSDAESRRSLAPTGAP